MMEKQSWVCTLVIQLFLCLAVYIALNMGKPQRPRYQSGSESSPGDLYFVSVKGGFRILKEQSQLLKQMEKVVKTYKARFVVNISELGQDDPLMLNATWYSQSLKVPWYTTRALKAQGADYFVKRIEVSYGQILDVIALDTGALQDFTNRSGNDQLHWLRWALEASNSSWKVAVGFHSLVACDDMTEQIEAKQNFELIQQILLKYGVNTYLSGQACFNCVHEGGRMPVSNAVAMNEGPYLTNINQKMLSNKKTVKGFLLHRIRSLEFVTYFVDLMGEVVHSVALQQNGRDAM